jgi:hypothetical protein
MAIALASGCSFDGASSAAIDGGETVDAAILPACATSPLYLELAVVPGQSRYLFSDDAFDFAAAPAVCEADEARLLIAESSGEAQGILAERARLGLGAVWIGLLQNSPAAAPDANWTWVDGSAVDAQIWLANEPNDGGGEENGGEDCGIFRDDGADDRNCNESHPVVCECDPGAPSR